jgi:hypothetical protein
MGSHVINGNTLTRYQPIRMKSRDVESKVEITAEEGVIELVGWIFCHHAGIRWGQKVIDGQLRLNLCKIGQPMVDFALVRYDSAV